MKNYLFIIILTILALNLKSQNNSDLQEITKTCLDYFEGWYTADPVRISNALHPDLVNRTIYSNQKTGSEMFETKSKSIMVDYTRARATNKYDVNQLDLKVKSWMFTRTSQQHVVSHMNM